jgi:uncharacterized membrane protein (DUF485 family)
MLNGSRAARTYASAMERLTAQVAVLLGAFAAAVGLAEALGAVSLGVAFGFGQIAFSLALGCVLLRL